VSKNSEPSPYFKECNRHPLISPRHTNTIFVGKLAQRLEGIQTVGGSKTIGPKWLKWLHVFLEPGDSRFWLKPNCFAPWRAVLALFWSILPFLQGFALVSVLYPYGWVAVSCCPYVWVDSLVGTEHHRKPMVAGPVHIIDITVQGATKDSEQAAWCRGGLVTPLGSPHSLYGETQLPTKVVHDWSMVNVHDVHDLGWRG
jgi:hypothetical protein